MSGNGHEGRKEPAMDGAVGGDGAAGVDVAHDAAGGSGEAGAGVACGTAGGAGEDSAHIAMPESGATLLMGVDGQGREFVIERIDDEIVDSSHFPGHAVRHLHIGARVRDVSIPRTGDALLDRVTIDPRNPHLATDGTCLFTKDGSTLIRCLAKAETYRIPESCRRIAEEAFAYSAAPTEIVQADSLEEIGRRAFIGSCLRAFRLPASLHEVGEEAFARCHALKSIELAEGLERIGDQAFSGCVALEALAIPASVRRIGNNVFAGCRLVAGGDQPTITIDPENGRYFIDAAGVLYRRGARGLTLIEALDKVTGPYRACPGTVRVERHAFAHHRGLSSIMLPEGVEEICDEAFLECRKLADAHLPSTVRRIGEKAFFHTSLSSLRLPAALESIGDLALLPYGKTIVHQANMTSAVHAFHIGSGLMVSTSAATRRADLEAPSRAGAEEVLQQSFVSVDPDSPRFRIERGFLCEDAGGRVRALQYVAGGGIVSVPPDVSVVCAYALYGAAHVYELHLHDGIEEVGKQGLMVTRPLECIRLRMDGAETVLYPALNSYGIYAQNQAFADGTPDFGRLIELCDGSLVNMHASPERTRRMIARLGNGRGMSDEARGTFEEVIRGELDETVALFSRVDDLQGLGALVDLGFIGGGNIARAIGIANEAGSVAVTHWLLEEKRRRFGAGLDDLDL